jgi:hypothetical protein
VSGVIIAGWALSNNYNQAINSLIWAAAFHTPGLKR